MFETDSPNPFKISFILNLILCLCIIGIMVMLSLTYPGSAAGWLNNPSIEQHHLIEFDEEIYVFAFFVIIVTGITMKPNYIKRLPVCTVNPSPQTPPPK
jgi:hypothetical protein